MTKQPVWKFVANLGDANPLEYGGFFVFEDETGVYPAEAEYYDPDEGKTYRILLERKELWAGHLIPHGFSKRTNLPHPTGDYIEWFDSYLTAVASVMGIKADYLAFMFTSPFSTVLAEAYRCLGEAEGWDNLDSDPLELTPAEAKQRYKDYL
jgi:hypothetical protein